MAALFLIVKNWKQPKCPSADERVNELGPIHTMEVRRNAGLRHAKAQMSPKIVMLGERNQTEKRASYMLPFIENSRKCKLTRSLVA